MKSNPLSHRLLFAGLALATVLDTAGQLLWKYCAGSLPQDAAWPALVAAVLHQPLFLLLVGIFLLQLFNWMKVLEHADLSFAQPITSLSYVSVCALSVVFFNETMGVVKSAGVLCILGGVWMISRGKALSADSGGDAS